MGVETDADFARDTARTEAKQLFMSLSKLCNEETWGVKSYDDITRNKWMEALALMAKVRSLI